MNANMKKQQQFIIDGKERLICSAIWLPEYTNPEIGKLPHQPRNVDKGLVISGIRHYNCIMTLYILTNKSMHEFGEDVQGFLTNTHRFVNRYEAAEIALAAGQIEHKTDMLYSEDVW